MTRNEFELFDSLLDRLDDSLSGAICNDMYLENTEANWELVDRAYRWGGGGKPYGRPRPTTATIPVMDFVIFAYLRHLLRREYGAV